MFDVIAVNISTRTISLIARNKSERNAEAIVSMAVMRRGVDETFFTAVPAWSYKDGDRYGE